MVIDPYRLLQETARRLLHREIGAALVPVLPPLAVALAALAFGRLPIELAVAGAIAAGVLALYVATLPSPLHAAAHLIDASLGGKDHFLTLATVPSAEPGESLLPLVESSAGALAAGGGAIRLPARSLGRFWKSLVVSLGLAVVLWMLPELASLASPASPLDDVASRLAAGGEGDRVLATELHDLAKTLRDASVPKEEKRKKVAELLAKIEKQQSQDRGSNAGGAGKKSADKARSSGTEGKGQKQSGPGGSAGQQSGQGAKGAAQKELQKIQGELSGESGEGESSGKQGAKQQQGGGGIQGPDQGAKEREGKSQGNQESSTGGKPDEKRRGTEQGDAQGGEAKRDQGTGDPGQANVPNQALGSDARSEGSSTRRPAPGDTGQPAERYYKDGEGPDGWRIENGRYVRVRIPDQARGAETEHVSSPGDVEVETPYGNAPLPSAGSPGEVSETQPAPLEYRDVLGAK